MAAITKFSEWIGYATKAANVGSDTFTIALTNVAPTAATDSVLADITQIAYTNLSARVLTTTSSAVTTGTLNLILADLTLTASGGSVAAWRYVVIYDETVAGDPLVAFADRGSSVTLADGESVLLDFVGSALTFS
jgi:hypothetical protein